MPSDRGVRWADTHPVLSHPAGALGFVFRQKPGPLLTNRADSESKAGLPNQEL